MSNGGGRQHGDFVARKIDRGQPLRGFAIQRRIRRYAQSWYGDMHAYLPVTVFELRDRKRVVDFRRSGVIDAESLHRRQFQVARFGGCERGIETRAAWKSLE